jgi:hypothetical protein
MGRPDKPGDDVFFWGCAYAARALAVGSVRIA